MLEKVKSIFEIIKKRPTNVLKISKIIYIFNFIMYFTLILSVWFTMFLEKVKPAPPFRAGMALLTLWLYFVFFDF